MKIFKGFSLPEVLITMTIIGVVSAMTIPTVIREFNERTNTYREINIVNKITNAMSSMYAQGDLNYYDSTEEFVTALAKYLKISKICTAENLEECWPSKIVKTAERKNYEVKNAKTGLELHTGNLTNNVGLILTDGSQLILSYDPSIGATAGDNITPIKKTLPVGFGKEKEFAYTTSITSGIDFVMDVNGTAGPNAETTDNGEYNDIRSFRGASFSQACPGKMVNEVCIYYVGTNYTPINCLDERNALYCQGGSTPRSIDYWGGGQKACMLKGMKVINGSQLNAVAPYTVDYIPTGNNYIGGTDLGCIIREDRTVSCGGNGAAWVRRASHSYVCIRDN